MRFVSLLLRLWRLWVSVTFDQFSNRSSEPLHFVKHFAMRHWSPNRVIVDSSSALHSFLSECNCNLGLDLTRWKQSWRKLRNFSWVLRDFLLSHFYPVLNSEWSHISGHFLTYYSQPAVYSAGLSKCVVFHREMKAASLGFFQFEHPASSAGKDRSTFGFLRRWP